MRALMISACLLMISCGGSSLTSAPPHTDTHTPGLDVYAEQNESMPCDWMEYFEGKSSMEVTILWGVGGASNECLRSFLRDPRPKTIKILLGNGVCKRRGTCRKEEGLELRNRVLGWGIEAVDMVRSHAIGRTRIILIIELEDNLTHDVAHTTCEHIKPNIGGEDVEIWRNPENPGIHDFNSNCFDGVRLHNERYFPPNYSGKCEWSNDGRDIDIPGKQVWELPLRYSDTEMLDRIRNRQARGCSTSVWAALESNCLRGDVSASPHISERDCSSPHRNISAIRELINKV